MKLSNMCLLQTTICTESTKKKRFQICTCIAIIYFEHFLHLYFVSPPPIQITSSLPPPLNITSWIWNFQFWVIQAHDRFNRLTLNTHDTSVRYTALQECNDEMWGMWQWKTSPTSWHLGEGRNVDERGEGSSDFTRWTLMTEFRVQVWATSQLCVIPLHVTTDKCGYWI